MLLLYNQALSAEKQIVLIFSSSDSGGQIGFLSPDAQSQPSSSASRAPWAASCSSLCNWGTTGAL